MPKAYPLPADPKEAEKVIRRRKQKVKHVTDWRKRHPAKNRATTRHAVALWRTARRFRAERHAMAA